MTEQKKRDSKFASRWRGLKNNPASLALFILVNLAALLSVLTLAFIVVYIVIRGIPNLSPELFALEYNSENVSMLPALINTVFMAIIALVVALPIGIGAAIYLVEYAKKGSRFVGMVRLTAETLTGIPSIIYGLWGFYVLRTVFMHLNLSPQGSGILTAAFVLAIMIVPYAASLSAEFIKMVPSDLKEGAYAMGATRAEVIKRVIFPMAGSGIFSAYILAIGSN